MLYYYEGIVCIFFFTGILPVFWILHFIVLCFRADRNVLKLLDNVLAENYQCICFFLNSIHCCKTPKKGIPIHTIHCSSQLKWRLEAVKHHRFSPFHTDYNYGGRLSINKKKQFLHLCLFKINVHWKCRKTCKKQHIIILQKCHHMHTIPMSMGYSNSMANPANL